MLEGRSKVITWPSNSSPRVVLIERTLPTAKSSLFASAIVAIAEEQFSCPSQLALATRDEAVINEKRAQNEKDADLCSSKGA